MNKQEVNQLEAGMEIDRLVAEACGIAVHDDIVQRLGSIPIHHWRPSTDWSDAILAIETFVGNESFSVARHIDHSQDETVFFWDIRLNNRFIVDTQPCGPLAICRAILLNARSKEGP